MRFTCPSCGARCSADEPASGRASSIRCRCGKMIVLGGEAPVAGGPVPASRYDAFAASHGLLIDEALARALAAGRPALAPATEAAALDLTEMTVASSPPAPAPAGKKKREKETNAEEKKDETKKEEPVRAAVPPRWVPPAWIVPAAALAAFVVAGGGAAVVLLPGGSLPSPIALATRLPPLLRGRAEAAPPLPAPPAAEPAGAPPAPRPAGAGPADHARVRAAGETGTAPRGKRPAPRMRRLARQAVADRR